MSRIDAEKILLAMGGLDERLIAEADELRSGTYLKKKRRRRQALGSILAAAACVGIILVAGRSTGLWQRGGLHSQGTQSAESTAAPAAVLEEEPAGDALAAVPEAAEYEEAAAGDPHLAASEEGMQAADTAEASGAGRTETVAEVIAKDALATAGDAAEEPAASAPSALMAPAAGALEKSGELSASPSAEIASAMSAKQAAQASAPENALAEAAEAPEEAPQEAMAEAESTSVTAEAADEAAAYADAALGDVLAMRTDEKGSDAGRAARAASDTLRLTVAGKAASYDRVPLPPEAEELLSSIAARAKMRTDVRPAAAAGLTDRDRWYSVPEDTEERYLVLEGEDGSLSLWEKRDKQ